ncbi:YbdD/YjiX family protein [Plesiomonas sp.]|uniref:YbdD/YjiX family protein n=1 Tax=Plesiomonas sp. TaxID=2486279 RepID=UPI003F33C6D4
MQTVKMIPHLSRIKLLYQRAAETARLMVGVPDYLRYVEHMQETHPELPVLTEAEFHRACIEARYPGKKGTLSKCPC